MALISGSESRLCLHCSPRGRIAGQPCNRSSQGQAEPLRWTTTKDPIDSGNTRGMAQARDGQDPRPRRSMLTPA